MVCCGMYGMVGFGCDTRDAMVLMVWLVSQPMRYWRVVPCGWVLVIMARLVRRCGNGAGCCDCDGCSDRALALASGAPACNHTSAELELASRTR